MRCIVHGDSSCPPFCSGVISAPAPIPETVDEGADGAKRTLQAQQHARETYAAGLDVAGARQDIARAVVTLRDVVDHCNDSIERLGDADALLAKYEARESE